MKKENIDIPSHQGHSHLSIAHKQNAVRKLDVCTEKKEIAANVSVSRG